MQLHQDDVELLLRELLIQPGDLGAGGELSHRTLDLDPRLGKLIADLLGVVLCVVRVGSTLPLFGAMPVIDKRNGKLNSDAEGVCRKRKQITRSVAAAEVLR